MTDYTARENLEVAKSLAELIENEVLPGTRIEPAIFWTAAAEIFARFAPENRQLLATRDKLQTLIDQWHSERSGREFDQLEYTDFLTSIGYLLPEPEDFEIATANVDPEVAIIAGPQLVVPVMNARYALNAANARWGSLYDALYGSDAIDENDGAERAGAYNPERGRRVIEFGRGFLDQAIPLDSGSHSQASSYSLVAGNLVIKLNDDRAVGLRDAGQLVGYTGRPEAPSSVLLRNNNLHVEICIDPNSEVGSTDAAGVSDIVMESAITAIQDCEDSIAAVDAEDKVQVYRNWLGLMNGSLQETFSKAGTTLSRTLLADRSYTTPLGETLMLRGRSLLFIRNVGHLMTTDAILDQQGNELPEGILDGLVTSLIAIHDIEGSHPTRNSATGSIYIVKPKMHGPEEVEFTDRLFGAIEDALSYPRYTIKMGIMDEERRTTVNLKACIRAASHRVAFINTGFLDRTGDEIHTSMMAGPFLPKGDIKNQPWISAYEDWNVDTGLAAGMRGRGQIGKGMWAMPDLMAEMLRIKISHPQAGANTAWVPSPTAATLHAIHYHQVNVATVQQELCTRAKANLNDILTIPLLHDRKLSDNEIERELENNIQGILGYVVRWVNSGVGCSKVPDINNVGLMEDRATLRISSQHIANWLVHKVCLPEQVEATLQRMAAVVDQQNAGDPNYQNMAPHLSNSIAYQAAQELIFQGCQQPNGYTEPLLHARRRDFKRHAGGI
jgi:malate synthase